MKYYGRSPKLGPVEVIIDNFKSCFFIPSTTDLPDLNSKFDRKSVEMKSFNDEPVDALYFSSQKDCRNAADQLRMAGIKTFESEIKPDERFLMENVY